MLKDVLAFAAPTCMVFCGYCYFRMMTVLRSVKAQDKALKEVAQNLAIDIANQQQLTIQLSHRIDQVASSFVDGRECPMCGIKRPAKEFGELDYVCKSCRDESLDALNDELDALGESP